MYTVENFIEGFKAIFPRTTANTADGVINFSRTSLGNYDTIFCKMSVDDIETEIRSLSNTILNDDLILTNENYYEMPVKPNDSMRIPLYRAYENGDFLEERHSYKFNICKSSPKYIVALICYLSNNKDKKLDFMSLRHRIIHSNPIESFKDFCDVFPVVTVQILAPQSCSIVEFSNLFKSYAFNIAYVNNVVFSKTDLVEPTRSRRCSVNRSGQLFPYKKHNKELLKYYYQGLSTDIPFAQYLAFYHVAEFYFQTIAEDDAFQLIETLITRPSFSPHRKKDIKDFYNKIKKKMSEQNEEGVWKEKVGLRLCLEKYIPDIETLKNSIASIDSNAITYYNNSDVPFATENSDNSIRINFDDTSAVYANICNRVYLVRNAIAHSKEGNHLRYEPFSHDAELAKEIPLIRAIAEEIIINSAKTATIKYDG